MLAFHFVIICIFKILVYPCSGFLTPDTCVFFSNNNWGDLLAHKGTNILKTAYE